MKLKSKNYGVEYEKDSDIFEMGLRMKSQKYSFSIDVQEDLTGSEDLMNEFSKNIDGIETIKTKVFEQVHDIYKNNHDQKEAIDFFLEFYIKDIDEEYQPKIFGISIEELKKFEYNEVIDLLILRRFGVYKKDGNINYIVDLSFNPEVSDQLLVIHVDRTFNIINITNES